MRRVLSALIFSSIPLMGFAGDVEIVAVKASPQGDSWRFDVTLAHADTGWEHYTDGWKVLTPDGTELGYRELLHPHVNEQPFTRSLSGVVVPPGTTTVLIQAHDNVHGWSESLEVTLP